jgi:hypothetical protein
MNNFKYTIDFKDNKDDDFYGNKNEDGSVCFMKKIDSADDFFYTVRDLIKRLPDRISREDYNRCFCLSWFLCFSFYPLCCYCQSYLENYTT